MKVFWTETAEENLQSIYIHIAHDSAEYAKRVVDCITRRSQQIGDFPHSGRRVPEYDDNQIREVIEGSFCIIYLVKNNQIDILAVIHGAMNILGR